MTRGCFVTGWHIAVEKSFCGDTYILPSEATFLVVHCISVFFSAQACVIDSCWALFVATLVDRWNRHLMKRLSFRNKTWRSTSSEHAAHGRASRRRNASNMPKRFFRKRCCHTLAFLTSARQRKLTSSGKILHLISHTAQYGIYRHVATASWNCWYCKLGQILNSAKLDWYHTLAR